VRSHHDDHTPPVSSSPGCRGAGPPRAPCAPQQRKTSTSPQPTDAKPETSSPGGHVKPRRHPSASNHSMLSSMLETLRIGVTPTTSMRRA